MSCIWLSVYQHFDDMSHFEDMILQTFLLWCELTEHFQLKHKAMHPGKYLLFAMVSLFFKSENICNIIYSKIFSMYFFKFHAICCKYNTSDILRKYFLSDFLLNDEINFYFYNLLNDAVLLLVKFYIK